MRQRPPGPASEDDYQSFCATLGSSARGRAFLNEYAKRNRHADTEVLLAALDRLEAQMRSQAGAFDGAPAPPEPDLAIPSPANDEPRSSAQAVRTSANALPASAMLPELNYFDGAAAAEVESDAATATYAAQFESPVAADDDRPSEMKTEKPARDPLAAIMALSEDERIALFT